MRADGYEKHKGADGKITYIIDLRITDGELKQIYEELGDAPPTEENISATPTFRRIWECIYPEMVKIDEENKKTIRMMQTIAKAIRRQKKREGRNSK